jgi:hypothetical protein
MNSYAYGMANKRKSMPYAAINEQKQASEWDT